MRYLFSWDYIIQAAIPQISLLSALIKGSLNLNLKDKMHFQFTHKQEDLCPNERLSSQNDSLS